MTALRPGPTTAAVVPDERDRVRRLSGPVLMAAGLAVASVALHLLELLVVELDVAAHAIHIRCVPFRHFEANGGLHS